MILLALAAPRAALANAVTCGDVIADAEFLSILESDTVPRDFVVLFADARSGADRGLTYLRTETVRGERKLVFRSSDGSEVRFDPDELFAEGRSGSFRIGRPGSEPRPISEPHPATGGRTDPVAPPRPPSASEPARAEARRAGDQVGTFIEGRGAAARRAERRSAPQPPIRRDASSELVAGTPIHYPAIEYNPVRRAGETAVTRAESLVGRPLGSQLGQGGTRRVFPDPRDGRWVLKVYDPSVAKGGLADHVIARLIQQELAMEDFLVRAGFRVARIDRSPAAQALWKFGIVRQENIAAIARGRVRPYLEAIPATYRPGTMPAVDLFHSRLRLYDDALREANERHIGLDRRIRHFSGSPDVRVGIDVGGRYTNVLVDDTGVPILIDW
jgi:hypothetical protein